MSDHSSEMTELEKRLREEAEKEAQADAAAPEGGDASAEGDAGGENPKSETAEQHIETLEAELESTKDSLLRLRAEFDNYRKRVARENERIRKTAAESVVRELLAVVDNLELALQHADESAGPLAQGVEMVNKQLAGLLSAQGVQPIPAVGEKFDPNVHEALSKTPSAEISEDHIAQEYQRGYMLGDQVLRASKVVVSSGPESSGETE